jgi:hypothetical protein
LKSVLILTLNIFAAIGRSLNDVEIVVYIRRVYSNK